MVEDLFRKGPVEYGNGTVGIGLRKNHGRLALAAGGSTAPALSGDSVPGATFRALNDNAV